VQPQQHFTEPPPRFTEASLVKALEEYGIGRPSTYASIISTLRDREYVEIENRRFTATDIGKIVNRFLSEHFHQYVDYGFTAAMEDELDAVARGEEGWTTPLSKFWKPFIKQVDSVEKNVTREQVAQARELGRDEASGKPMTVRMGRFGPFVQIGTKDDVEKPRFAGLRPGQKMDKITLEEAVALFILPRTLGATAEGEPILANVGRFGPYIKFGSKYVSLKDDDPYTVTLERALECIQAKKLADANRIIQDFGVDAIQVLNGRYGPYISNGEKNARVPKDRDPKTLTLEDSRALLAAAPARGVRGRGRFAPKKTADKPEAAATAKPAGRRGSAKTAAPEGEGVAASVAAASAAPPKSAKKKAAATRLPPRPVAKAAAKSAGSAASSSVLKSPAKSAASAARRAPTGKKAAGAA
jgi:DNA topoisomerase-1